MRKANPLVSDDSVNAILEIANAFQKSKILLTACELEIFSVLGDEPKTSKEVAYESGTDERAVDRLMNALCSMKLLEKNGNKFSNTKGTRRFLVKDSPEYLGRLMHLTHLWDTWGTLTDAVRKGTAVKLDTINDKDDEWVWSFVESMYKRSLLQAPDIVNMLDLKNINNVLDLGCGSGIYSINLHKLRPDMKITAFDFPKVLKFTEELMKNNNVGDNVTTMPGDFLVDDIGKGYDMVFISFVLHDYSLWDNVQTLQKVYDSLVRGGKIVIQEYIAEDNRTQPENAVVHSLNMLVNTPGGDTFTETDIWIMLKEAWFSNFKMIKTEFSTNLIIAEK